MSATGFQSQGALQFAQLGLTSSINGLTTTQTLYEVGGGGTFVTSFGQPAPNFILGNNIAGQTYISTSYVGISFSILSLTTNSARLVEVGFIGTTASSFVEMSNPTTTSTEGYDFRCIRGPSTLIGEYRTLFSGSAQLASRMPPSAFKWIDFAPLDGSATYLIEGKCVGGSTIVNLSNIQVLVRQI